MTDTAQNILDRATRVVRVGTVSAELTDLQAILERDAAGTPFVNVTLSVDSTGSQELTGAMAVFQVLSGEGEIIAATVTGVPDLGSAESTRVVASIDVLLSPLTVSQIVTYVTFEACATQPVVADVIDRDPPRVTVDPLSTNDTTPELTGTVDDPDARVEISIEEVREL